MTWLGPHQRPRLKDHPLTCHSPILPLFCSLFSPKVWQTNPTQRAESRANTISELNETLSHTWSTEQRDSHASPATFAVYPHCTGLLIAFGGISPDWAGPKPQSLCAITHTPGPRSPLWLWTSGGGAALWITGAQSADGSSQPIGYRVELRLIDRGWGKQRRAAHLDLGISTRLWGYRWVEGTVKAW